MDVTLPQRCGRDGGLDGPFDGAHALALMGNAALACAARHAGCRVVIARADGIEFSRPVAPGTNVEVEASIAFQGRSSMTVIVEIVASNAAGADARPAMSGRFMVLAVDHDGRPVPISISDHRTAEEFQS